MLLPMQCWLFNARPPACTKSGLLTKQCFDAAAATEARDALQSPSQLCCN